MSDAAKETKGTVMAYAEKPPIFFHVKIRVVDMMMKMRTPQQSTGICVQLGTMLETNLTHPDIPIIGGSSGNHKNDTGNES